MTTATIANAKTLTVDSTANAITLGVANGNINAANAGNGTLALTGPNTITVASAVGNGLSLSAVTTGAGAVSFSDVVKATTVTTNAGAVSFAKTITGNVSLGNAASQQTYSDGAQITGNLTNNGGAAGKGTAIFVGASKITGTVGNGGDGALAEVRTGTGLMEFGNTVVTQKLTIGAGNVTTANNVTVGAAAAETAITGTGNLIFTADKTLKMTVATTKVAISATNKIIVGAAGAAGTLIIDPANAAAGHVTVVNGALTSGDAASIITFNNSTGFAGVVRVTANIGDATTGFDEIALANADDGVALFANVKAYTTALTLNADAARLDLHAGSAVVGTITPAAAGNGTVTVYGNTGGNTTKLGANALGTLTFAATSGAVAPTLDAAENSTFTFLQDNAAGTKTIRTVNFNGKAGDLAGIAVDMSTVAVGNTTGLVIGNGAGTGIVHAADGSTGVIKFINNTNKAPVTLATAVANSGGGSFARHLALIDAGTASKITLTAPDTAPLHVHSVVGTEVELSGADVAIYGEGATNYTLAGANSTILTKSVMGSKAAPLTFNYKINNSLIVQDAVNVYASAITVDSTVAGANNGAIVLQGDNKLVIETTAGTEPKSLTAVNISGVAGKTAEITSLSSTRADLYAPVAFIAGSTPTTTLKLGVDVHGSVTTLTTGNGIVNLQGGNIDGSLGSALLAVAKVQLDTTDKVTVGALTAASTVGTGATDFLQDGTLALHKNVTAATLGTVGTKNTNTGTLELNQAATLTSVGDEALALKKVSVGENVAITVTGKLWAQNVTTAKNNEGTLNFTTNDSTSTTTNIGSADKRFLTVSAGTAGRTVKLNEIYAKDITVTGILAAKRFDATGTNGTALAAASTAQVLDGGYIGLVTSTGATTNVVVDGSATLDANIGTTGAANIVALRLNGVAGKVVQFNGDTLNANLTQAASTLALTKNTTVAGTSAFTGSTIDLGKNSLTLTGAVTLNGDTKVKFIPTSGKPVITVGGTVSVALPTDKVTLVKTEGGSYLRSGTTLSIFGDANGNTVKITNADADTIAFADTRFLTAKVNSVDGTVTFEGAAEAESFASASALKDPNVKGFVETLKTFANNSTGKDVKAEEFLGMLEQLPSDAKVSEATTRMTARSGPSAVVSAEVLNGGVSSMTNRMGQTSYAAAPVGVAAGDAGEKFGVWAEAKVGSSDQKLRKDNSGFKSKSFGGVVGVDTMLNEAATLGVMVGNVNGNVKFKDTKSGDKNKTTSWLFGAYGGYEFANNFFVQANAAVAQTNVKSKERRVSLTGYDTATGKYDVMGFAAEVRGGYNYRFESSTVTPTVGLRYNYSGDTSYTETGAGVSNLKVANKSAGSLSGVAGVKLGTTVDMNGSMLMPEVHMNVDYALTKATSKAAYSLDGSSMNFNYKGAKAAKFGYNFGASVMTKTDNVEYGVGYDANIADKYLGHQGSLKVRMAF
jgi:outer membrane autotransporter protein